jgi:hypothetical protein
MRFDSKGGLSVIRTAASGVGSGLDLTRSLLGSERSSLCRPVDPLLRPKKEEEEEENK